MTTFSTSGSRWPSGNTLACDASGLGSTPRCHSLVYHSSFHLLGVSKLSISFYGSYSLCCSHVTSNVLGCQWHDHNQKLHTSFCLCLSTVKWFRRNPVTMTLYKWSCFNYFNRVDTEQYSVGNVNATPFTVYTLKTEIHQSTKHQLKNGS